MTKRKTTASVVAGPTTIGNSFGSYGHHVPEGKWAVVAHGEYSNGGYGLCQVGERKLYDSREEAEAAAQALGEFEYC